MNLNRATLRSTIDNSLCRRRQERQKIHAVRVKTWTPGNAPVCVTMIEGDLKGARLMFPFRVSQNETVKVSFEDEMGFYQTREARIAWIQEVSSGYKFVAGVAFNEELAA